MALVRRASTWPTAIPIRYLCTSSVLPQQDQKPEHRVQYNYDVFSLHPEEEHYSLPLVTAEQLARSKTRPRSMRMLTRDFIYDSLYNPHYGYFSRQAVLLPLSKQANPNDVSLTSAFAFHDMKDETEFMRTVQLRYMNFDEQFRRECQAREKRMRGNGPTLQERIDALVQNQKRTPWGSACLLYTSPSPRDS